MPKVLAETPELLVLDKPAGRIVHSDGRTEEPSVASWLLEHYPALEAVGEPWVSPQGEEVRVAGVVHRLDRTTSGVLLVAKTPEMFSYLKGELKARRVEKIYRAYVYGHMEAAEGRIVAEIVRSSGSPACAGKARRWYARECDERDVRAALTEWQLLKKVDGPASYLEIRPRTGRTHQIRVHLAHIGHAIVADHIYAADKPALLGFTRPALHAHSISFSMPSGEKVSYTAPFPGDFARVEGVY